MGFGGNERRPIVGIMNSGLSWDEFRLVKSIAEARSLVGAAELLGLNHSTVFRRLAAVEAAVGARLFERSRAGYKPTVAGEEMIALATAMAESVVEFERRVAGRDVKPTGELIVTVPGAVGLHFMPAIVAQFQAQHPGVVVELILSNHTLDLSRRDADIAIRLTNDPPETLVGRRICTGRWAVYCRRDVAAALAAEPIEFCRLHWIWREYGASAGPAMDRDQCRSWADRGESEFSPLHARVGAPGVWRGVAALFSRRSTPGPRLGSAICCQNLTQAYGC